jgi:hypothetical protein
LPELSGLRLVSGWGTDSWALGQLEELRQRLNDAFAASGTQRVAIEVVAPLPGSPWFKQFCFNGVRLRRRLRCQRHLVAITFPVSIDITASETLPRSMQPQV